MTKEEIEIRERNIATNNTAAIIAIGNSIGCDGLDIGIVKRENSDLDTIKVIAPSNSSLKMVSGNAACLWANDTDSDGNDIMTISAIESLSIISGTTAAVKFIDVNGNVVGELIIPFVSGHDTTVKFSKEADKEQTKLSLAKGMLEASYDIYGALAYLEDNIEDMQAAFESNEHGEDLEDSITIGMVNKYVELAKEIVEGHEAPIDLVSNDLNEPSEKYMISTIFSNKDTLNKLMDKGYYVSCGMSISANKSNATTVCLNFSSIDEFDVKAIISNGSVKSARCINDDVSSVELTVDEDFIDTIAEFQLSTKANGKSSVIGSIFIEPVKGHYVTMKFISGETDTAAPLGDPERLPLEESENKGVSSNDGLDVTDIMISTERLLNKVSGKQDEPHNGPVGVPVFPTKRSPSKDGGPKVVVYCNDKFTVRSELGDKTAAYNNILKCYVFAIISEFDDKNIIIIPDDKSKNRSVLYMPFVTGSVTVYDLR